MSRATIQGKEYELRLDLDAMEKLQDEFGNIAEALKDKSIRSLRKVFIILANSARSYKGEPEDIDGGELKHATLAEIGKMGDAIMQAQREAIRTDTVNGEADDEHHNATLEKIEAEEEKNGETGEG